MKLKYESTLFWYDGPMLYTSLDENQNRYLSFFVSDSGVWHVLISDLMHEDILNSKIEIRDVFLAAESILVSDFEFISYSWRDKNSLDLENLLPEKGFIL